MNHHQHISPIDRLAPVVASIVVAGLVLAAVLYGAHQFAAAVDSLSMMIGGRL